jgi:hypothetical protein
MAKILGLLVVACFLVSSTDGLYAKSHHPTREGTTKGYDKTKEGTKHNVNQTKEPGSRLKTRS